MGRIRRRSRSRSGCGSATVRSRARPAPAGSRPRWVSSPRCSAPYAVLVQLLLMSRIAWLERAIGLDRLAVWHRWNGFATVWLLVAHVVFTTVGYAQGDRRVAVGPDARLRLALSRRADGVGRARAVLRGRGHVGADRATGPPAPDVVLRPSVRVPRGRARRSRTSSRSAPTSATTAPRACGGSASTLVVFGAILWWRVIAPVRFNLRHDLRVHSVKREAPGVVSILIRGRHLDGSTPQPGQFFLWRFLTPTGWWQAHPFSLSAAPTKNRMRITVKDLGDHSERLQHVRPGVRVLAEGPYGTFTPELQTTPPGAAHRGRDRHHAHCARCSTASDPTTTSCCCTGSPRRKKRCSRTS